VWSGSACTGETGAVVTAAPPRPRHRSAWRRRTGAGSSCLAPFRRLRGRRRRGSLSRWRPVGCSSDGLGNDLTFEVVRRQPDDYLMITRTTWPSGVSLLVSRGYGGAEPTPGVRAVRWTFWADRYATRSAGRISMADTSCVPGTITAGATAAANCTLSISYRSAQQSQCVWHLGLSRLGFSGGH
jgi:hypothetical protein